MNNGCGVGQAEIFLGLCVNCSNITLSWVVLNFTIHVFCFIARGFILLLFYFIKTGIIFREVVFRMSIDVIAKTWIEKILNHFHIYTKRQLVDALFDATLNYTNHIAKIQLYDIQCII